MNNKEKMMPAMAAARGRSHALTDQDAFLNHRASDKPFYAWRSDESLEEVIPFWSGFRLERGTNRWPQVGSCDA
jgi:hypothetical protein